MITIGLIGQVSSGKSSLVNALAGEFTSPVSMGRTTIFPRYYIGPEHGRADSLDLLAEQALLGKINNLTTEEKKIVGTPVKLIAQKLSPNIQLIDFAGINDAANTSVDVFMNVFIENLKFLDIVLFVTSAASPFTLSGEVEAYRKISAEVDKMQLKYIKLYVVFNKYDDTDDELDGLIATACEKNKITDYFKLSTYRLMHASAYSHDKNPTPDWVVRERRKIIKAGRDTFREHEFTKFIKDLNEHTPYCTIVNTLETQLRDASAKGSLGNFLPNIYMLKQFNDTLLARGLPKEYISEHLQHIDTTLNKYIGIFSALEFVFISKAFNENLHYIQLFGKISGCLGTVAAAYRNDIRGVIKGLGANNFAYSSVNPGLIPFIPARFVGGSYVKLIDLINFALVDCGVTHVFTDMPTHITIAALIWSPDKKILTYMDETYEQAFANVLIHSSHYTAYDSTGLMKNFRAFVINAYVLKGARGRIGNALLEYLADQI